MSGEHSIAKRRTDEDEVRRYPVNRLCALAGVTRQAFYKRDEDALLARLAIEQFVVQFVLGVRLKDPKIGTDKLWRMYIGRFPEEYRVGRDVFRSIMHERGLHLRRRPRATRTTDSRHSYGPRPTWSEPANLPLLWPASLMSEPRQERNSHAAQPHLGQRHHLY